MNSRTQFRWSSPRNAAPPLKGPPYARPAVLQSGETDALLAAVGRAIAVATIARTATVAAQAIREILFNIQFPPLGLPTVRRRAGLPVGRSGESGGRW